MADGVNVAYHQHLLYVQEMRAERAEAQVKRLTAALDRDRCVCFHNHGDRHESQCEEFRAAVDRIREIAGLPND